MVRAVSFSKNGLKKGSWSKEEDDKLSAYIQTHGHSNWRRLPKLAGLLRCGKSCRLRWMNYLRPDVKRGNFTKEEEDLIIKMHNQLGNKWSMIAKELPGRTDNEIKNQWHTNLKKRAQKNLKLSEVNKQSGETLQHAASSQVSGVSAAERAAVETSSDPNPLKSESIRMSNSLNFECATVVYGMKNSITSTESSETVASWQINKQTESVVLSATVDANPGIEVENYDQLLQEATFWNSPMSIPSAYGKHGDAESSPTSFMGILSGDDFWTQPFVADNAYNQDDYPSSFQEEMYTLGNDFFMDDIMDFICQPM